MRQHAGVIGLCGLHVLRFLGAWRHGEQLADARDVVGAIAIGEKPIVADAMEPFRQDVHQEAPDELVGVQRHRRVPARSIDPVILAFERDAGVVGRNEPAVRDGDAMGVA